MCKYKLENNYEPAYNDWKIIQDGFSKQKNRFFESIMSSGNGRMGLRNQEEGFIFG